jgi:hypothetical protein
MRDRDSGAIHITSFCCSAILMQGMLAVLDVFLFAITTYFFVGLRINAGIVQQLF